MKKISVVLPTYNECENIVNLINAIETALEETLLEIIVVDDNSPDNTWKEVEDLRDEKVTLIRRMKERGVASAIGRGILEAEGGIIVWMDCDFSHPPEMLPKLVKTLNDYDIAVASRYVGDGRDERGFQRVLTSRVINAFARHILDKSIYDYTSGFIATKREVFKKTLLPSGKHGEYCIEFLYKAKKYGYKIKEVPYTSFDRELGETKTTSNLPNLAKYGWMYGSTILKLKLGG